MDPPRAEPALWASAHGDNQTGLSDIRRPDHRFCAVLARKSSDMGSSEPFGWNTGDMSNEIFDDEYDPLAPMIGRDVEEATEPVVSYARPGDVAVSSEDDIGFGLEDEDGESSANKGVSDSEGLVRLWFDDRGWLSKVRVSPVWFSRLAPGKTLAGAFNEALLKEKASRAAPIRAAEAAAAAEPELPTGSRDPMFGVARSELSGLSEFSLDEIGTYLGLMAKYRQTYEAQILAAKQIPPAQPREFVGRSAGVRVTLELSGCLAAVEFDEAWLDSVQVGSICTNVVAAAHRAYAKFEPVEDEQFSEIEDLGQGQRVLSAGLFRLLNHGGN